VFKCVLWLVHNAYNVLEKLYILSERTESYEIHKPIPG